MIGYLALLSEQGMHMIWHTAFGTNFVFLTCTYLKLYICILCLSIVEVVDEVKLLNLKLKSLMELELKNDA